MDWKAVIIAFAFCCEIATFSWGQTANVHAVHTNKKRFAIPFQSDSAEIQRLQAQEIRLYVSVDDGRNWQSVQTVNPTARRFTVQAPRDGAYWFAVRTVDRQNQLHPRGPISTEMKVVVDTTPPTLKLGLSQPVAGQVSVTWNAVDPNLDAQSLVIETREPGSTQWKKIGVEHGPNGKSTWSLSQGGTVEVRARITDRAGNAAVANDSIKLSPGRKVVPKPSVPNFSDPIAKQSPATRHSMPHHFPTQRPISSRKSEKKAARSPFQPQTPIAKTRRPPQETPVGPAFQTQRTGTQFPADSQSKPQRVESNSPRLMARKKQFRLNYAIEKVGKSGVHSVELFITTDGGRKWYRYGIDADRTSPFDVSVPQDGTYGFSIRVRSGVGLSDPPPQPGARPDVVVTVDQSAPQLQMLPVLQGQGRDANRFLIRWRTTDANPSKTPIAIAYSESATGPWKPITNWTADTGKHLWTAPEDVPPKAYLKIVAKDALGNISSVQTPRPIVVDGVKPRARITNVDSGSTAR